MPDRIPTLLKIWLSLALIAGVPAFAQDAGGGGSAPAPKGTIDDIKTENPCYQKQLEACKDKSRQAQDKFKAGLTSMADSKDDGFKAKGDQGQSLSLGSKAMFTDAASACKASADGCKDICKDAEKKKAGSIKSCEKDFSDLMIIVNAQVAGADANAMNFASLSGSVSTQGPQNTNPTNTTPSKGGGSGMGSMMGAMLPMAMMGAMMAMKQDKDDDKDQQQYQLPNNSALQANGTIDCSKADAGYYSDCNTYLSAACQQSIVNNTYATSATCSTFGARYCAAGALSTLTVPATSAPGAINPQTGQAITTPTMGQSGEGRATSFCQNVLAYNYCSNGGSPSCPSCRNLAVASSGACATNPSACLAQTSPNLIATARTTCPGDPIFSNPAYTTGLDSAAPAVLPAVGGTGTVTTATPGVINALNGNSPTAGTTTTPTVSAPAILPSSSSGLQAASVGGRQVAASTNAGGPTSDITGQFGPSVFSTGTQAISKLCQTHQLNCP